MRYRVLPYRQGSKGAKALADALGGKVLKLEGGKFKPKVGDVVINWGFTRDFLPPNLLTTADYDFLNLPPDIKKASNKLNFFNLLNEANPSLIPKFWTKKEDIPDDAYPIVCRQVLAGHSGDGIVIASTPDELVAAPLYVQYVKKKEEYRVHVGKQGSDQSLEPTVICIQRKARRAETPNEAVNWQVRNLAGGFIFQRNNVTCPTAVLSAAKEALTATGLDFGAVDVIWNAQQGKAYVLEINTAPGLEGSTVSDYVAYFTGATPDTAGSQSTSEGAA